MKIFYEQIKEEGLCIEDSFSFEEEGDKFNIEFKNGHIDKAGEAYVLSGEMELLFSCPCDRCLEPVNMDIKEKILMTLSPFGEYPEMENSGDEGLSDEEAGMYVTPVDHFDLSELLREEAILLVPEKRLCSEDCKGICPGCGASLNTEECRCSGTTDMRWEALKILKNNKDS